MTMIDQS